MMRTWPRLAACVLLACQVGLLVLSWRAPGASARQTRSFLHITDIHWGNETLPLPFFSKLKDRKQENGMGIFLSPGIITMII